MPHPPDVLWLSLESVRADHTPMYGYDRNTTPNLKRLSDRQESTVVDPAFSASMWTPASTASMLTGTHLSTHKVGADGKAEKKLPESLDTLPGLLADKGYRTALFSTNYYISQETGLDRGFQSEEVITVQKSNFIGGDSYSRDNWRCALRRILEGPTFDPELLKLDIGNSDNCLLAKRVERWFAEQYKGDRPFFAFAHIPSPHHPYRPITRFRDEFAGEIDGSIIEAYGLAQRMYAGSEELKKRMANGLDLNNTEWDGIKALYDAEILYADYVANRIIAVAESSSRGPLHVVVTGDHGELFGEQGIIGHNLSLHDGVTKVPMIVTELQGIRTGDGTLTQHIDVTRTIAREAGVDSEQFEGRDLRNGDRSYAISQRGVAHLNEYTKFNDSFDTSRFFKWPFTCVRTQNHKYVTNEHQSALYALPDETRNVEEEQTSVADSLSDIIDSEEIDWSREIEQEEVEFNEEARQQLRDLGYLS